MKSGEKNPAKELYNKLRHLTCEELWEGEVPRFERASPRERDDRVAVIRAVGVVFAEYGTEAQKNEVKQWLLRLLNDPGEKIRRYAMTALPKLGAGAAEEAALLALLRGTTNEREKNSIEETLNKIGGSATLETAPERLSPQTLQKIKASVAREQSPSSVRMDHSLSDVAGLRIHLRGRKGLETFVSEEVESCPRTRDKFEVVHIRPGLVVLAPHAPFSLGDLYALRCFGSLGFVLGNVADDVDPMAEAIASPMSRRIFGAFTEGALRYRLDFVSKGHQRGGVRLLANRVFAICPDLLNDASAAPWAVEIFSEGKGSLLELRPRLVPDPRFAYRRQDVPAASHPPLAACMARLAGRMQNEVVWDPFCGSGSEVIECALRGGVRQVYGTDLSEAAAGISQANFAAADVGATRGDFQACDFRDFAAELPRDSVSLILTNPPLGRRVQIGDLRELIASLFEIAATVLRPGGRLILINPVHRENPHPALKLESRLVVDLGVGEYRLEKYSKR